MRVKVGASGAWHTNAMLFVMKLLLEI